MQNLFHKHFVVQLAIILASLAVAHAEDLPETKVVDAVKQDARVVGSAVKGGAQKVGVAAKEVGVAAKEVALEVADAAQEGAHQVAAAAKSGVAKTKAAISGEPGGKVAVKKAETRPKPEPEE